MTTWRALDVTVWMMVEGIDQLSDWEATLRGRGLSRD
jgi:hypothetical protein